MNPRCLVLCLVGVAQAADFYVLPTGPEHANGERTAPFATLDRARDAARENKRRHPTEPVTVWMLAGDYFVNGSLELGPEDSGVTYRAVEDQGARIVNARRIQAADFQPVTEPATLARIGRLYATRSLNWISPSSGFATRSLTPISSLTPVACWNSTSPDAGCRYRDIPTKDTR